MGNDDFDLDQIKDEIAEKRMQGGWDPDDYPDTAGAREFEEEWRKSINSELTAEEAVIYAVGLPFFVGTICYVLSTIEF
jgi:hypothetical protein